MTTIGPKLFRVTAGTSFTAGSETGARREHELAVGEVEHIELDQVHPELGREPERAQRVLGRERGGTAVANAESPWARAAVSPLEGQHYPGRRMTTIAASSASSPPAKARQPAATARASSRAGSSRRRDRR